MADQGGFDPKAYASGKSTSLESFDPKKYSSNEKSDYKLPTEASGFVPTAIEAGKTGLAYGAKTLDALRALTGGPITGLAIEQLTGKPVFNKSEVGEAVNPFNTKKFPTTSEMLERAGVPSGAQLSDVIPSVYSEPGTPWYVPEKGGKLDFTVRGTTGTGIDIATDPLTYLTMGGNVALKKATDAADIVANTTRAAKAGLPLGEAAMKAAEAGATPYSKMAAMGEALQRPTISPVTSSLKSIGRGLYSGAIQPVESQGLKYGKREIGDVFRSAGVTNAKDLPEKAGEIVSNLINARNQIAEQAEKSGANISMERALQPARLEINRLRSIGGPDNLRVADTMEKYINEYTATNAGVPGIPAIPEKTITQPSALLDELGNPIQKTVTIPGTPEVPAIPAKPIYPKQAYDLTTSIGTPSSAYNEALQTPPGIKIKKIMRGGVRDENLNQIGQASGPYAQQASAELNNAAGKVLSTKQGQIQSERNLQKLEHAGSGLTGMDVGYAAAGTAHGGLEGGIKGFLFNKAGYKARELAMPAGYKLQQLAENPYAGALLDAYGREKAKQWFGQDASPYNLEDLSK